MSSKKIFFCFAILFLYSCEWNNGFKEDGLFVSQSCLLQNPELPLIIKETILKGNNCLLKLKSARYTKFHRDFVKKEDHVSFDCSSNLGAVGRSYSYKLDGKGSSRIILNSSVTNNSSELIKTIFHELLHLDGTKHYSDIDYPYSCEFHCFEDKVKFGKEVASVAKNICRGMYINPDDINYIIAMSSFFLSTKDRLYDRIFELNKYILKNFNKKRKLKLLFAQNLLKGESYFVGKYYIDLFVRYYAAHTITSSEKKVLDSFQLMAVPNISRNLLKYGELLANLFFQIHNGEDISLKKLNGLFNIDKSALLYTEKAIYKDLEEMRLVIVLLKSEKKKL
jgi:hypothetical protein